MPGYSLARLDQHAGTHGLEAAARLPTRKLTHCTLTPHDSQASRSPPLLWLDYSSLRTAPRTDGQTDGRTSGLTLPEATRPRHPARGAQARPGCRPDRTCPPKQTRGPGGPALRNPLRADGWVRDREGAQDTRLDHPQSREVAREFWNGYVCVIQ